MPRLMATFSARTSIVSVTTSEESALDLDVAEEAQDPLLGACRRRPEQQQEGEQGAPDRRHGQAAGRGNDTLGADWMLASASS